MAFKALSEVPQLVSITATSIQELTVEGAKILAIVAEIPGVFVGSKPATEVVVNEIIGTSTISNVKIEPLQTPTFSIPSITLPVSLPFEIPSTITDVCHLDFSIFGSVLKAIMTAFTMIINGIKDMMVSAINQAVSMFMVIANSMKPITDWLKAVISSVWGEVNRIFRKIQNKVFENDKKSREATTDKDARIAEIEKSLYERFITWMEAKMLLLGGIMSRLKTAVSTFFSKLVNVLGNVGNILLVLPISITELSSDVNCLMKVLTVVTK